MRVFHVVFYVVLFCLVSACAPTVGRRDTWQADRVRLELHFSGLNQPTDLRFLPDGRALATEQAGRVIALSHKKNRVVLDLRAETSCCGEQGLLSLALHPDFGRNGLVFLYGSNDVGDTVLSRVRLRPRMLTLEDGTYRVLRTFKQPGPTHNGGQLQFGPDAHLYLSLGDGLYRPSWLGALPYAQDEDRPLGKLLRFAVSETGVVSIPADNPFAARAGVEPAIWLKGLRNPWRFSFDVATGELFLSDVGETAFEEVTVQTLAQAKGANFGWPDMEGTRCRRGQCRDFVTPQITYPTREGCAVTGGYVYRGSALSELSGTYVFGDYCSGVILGAVRRGGTWRTAKLLDSSLLLSSFAQDTWGEVYVLDYGAGRVYRLASSR